MILWSPCCWQKFRNLFYFNGIINLILMLWTLNIILRQCIINFLDSFGSCRLECQLHVGICPSNGYISVSETLEYFIIRFCHKFSNTYHVNTKKYSQMSNNHKTWLNFCQPQWCTLLRIMESKLSWSQCCQQFQWLLHNQLSHNLEMSLEMKRYQPSCMNKDDYNPSWEK